MYNPYEKGRWYRTFLESDGTTLKITDSDLDVSIQGNYLKFPKDFHILDTKYDMNSITHSGNAVITIDVMSFPDGAQGIAKPLATAIDYGYIYTFGYFNK